MKPFLDQHAMQIFWTVVVLAFVYSIIDTRRRRAKMGPPEKWPVVTGTIERVEPRDGRHTLFQAVTYSYTDIWGIAQQGFFKLPPGTLDAEKVIGTTVRVRVCPTRAAPLAQNDRVETASIAQGEALVTGKEFLTSMD